MYTSLRKIPVRMILRLRYGISSASEIGKTFEANINPSCVCTGNA